MIYIICDYKLVGTSIAKNLIPERETRCFWLWKACNLTLNEELPELIIYVIPENIETEMEFIDFLSSKSKIGTKILLISSIEAQLLFPFCNKYNIEGIIDFDCKSVALNEVVDRILKGEIIRDIINIESRVSFPMKLTTNDLALAKLLFQEKTASEIALILNVTTRTVERSRKRLYVKCKVKTVLGLYKSFIRQKLV